MSEKRRIPIAKLDASCVWTPEMDEAASAVLRSLPDDRREYAGAIYQQEGPEGLLEYCYSQAIPGTNDNFAFASEPGRKLAAMWHSHPAAADSDHFSPHDINVSTALKRPSYILDQASQEIRRFDPGKSATKIAPRNGRLEAGARISRGEPVPERTRREELSMAYDEALRGAQKK